MSFATFLSSLASRNLVIHLLSNARRVLKRWTPSKERSDALKSIDKTLALPFFLHWNDQSIPSAESEIDIFPLSPSSTTSNRSGNSNVMREEDSSTHDDSSVVSVSSWTIDTVLWVLSYLFQ